MSSISSLNSLLSSNSGIDLSSILQALTGSSSSGIDVSSAVSASITAARAPENNWTNQETLLSNQSSAITALQSGATSLDNDMLAMNSLTGPFSSATVVSSNSNIVTGSAASGTATGNDVIVVNNLASTDSWSSNVFSGTSATLPTGSFVITGANGTSTTINTGNGVDTLGELAQEINNDDLGVSASVVNDASGSRLSIIATNSGNASSFSVSSSIPDLSFAHAVTGANASLTVNGIPIQSASNIVTGAIPGLTLNLLSASPGTEVSLSVENNISDASTAISQFVNDYNTLIGQLNAQFSDSGSGQGVLADDPTVQALQSELLQTLSYTATTTSGGVSTVTSLASLGINMNNDGTLSVDSSSLNNALQNNFSAVQNFFQGSSLNGFANSLDQQLTSFLSPANGAFTVDLNSMKSEYTDFQNDISNFETNTITPLQAQLQSEFSQAEIALQQLPAEMKNLNAELGLNNNSNS